MENARFCTRCGTSLDKDSHESSETHGLICSNCGTLNPFYASFCMECGTELISIDFHETGAANYSGNEMESLELTPAESFLLMDLDADGKELFKLTMLDLFARRVIKMQTFQEDKGFSVTKPGIFHEIQRGEEFETLLQPYEEVFRKPLYSYEEIEIYQYVQMVLKNISPVITNSFLEYKEAYLIYPLIEDGYIEQVKKPGLDSRDHYQLTDLGEDRRKKISDILKDADYLGEWVTTHPERAKAFLSAVGSHVFILNYDLDTLRFLENNLTCVKSNTSKFYPYYLFPLEFLKDFGSEESAQDIFGMDVLQSFEFFETLDPFDDIFDAFE